jgi:SnoaL-like domain
MTQLNDLIDRYFAMWNETDVAQRRDLIARTWTETASYVDPLIQGDGREGNNAMVEMVQGRFPGHKFRLTSAIDAHHDRVCFSWDLAPDGGAPVAKGIDFGAVADGQRLQTVTGFLDTVTAA